VFSVFYLNRYQVIMMGVTTKSQLLTKPGSSLHFILILHQLLVCSYLKGTSPWQHTVVFNCVLHSSQTITDSVLDLGQRVLVWSLHQQGDREWVLAILNKRVLVFTL